MSEFSDRTIKHLEMIQRVIERMAGESARMKQFALASAAAMATTATATGTWPLAIAGVLLSLVFWGLDAKYLVQERWFRTLYDRTREHPQTCDFTLTPHSRNPCQRKHRRNHARLVRRLALRRTHGDPDRHRLRRRFHLTAT